MSNIIYNNYVYLITQISTNKKYIGVRTSKNNIHPENDLGKFYFGSSKVNGIRKKDQKLNYSDYIYEILYVSQYRKNAEEEEERLHAELNVAFNNEYYNIKNANGSLNTKGFVVVKDKNNKTMLVRKDDIRYLSGELVFITTGLFIAKDKKGNTFQIDLTDSRYLSGELVPFNKNKVVAKDKNGIHILVDTDDIRLKNGELLYLFYNMVAAKDKDGNIHHVTVDEFYNRKDELVGITKGKTVVKDKDGNTLQVDIDDPRYLSGELVGIAKDKVNVKDKEGNTFQVDIDDPRYLSGELVGHSRGKYASVETKTKMSLSHTKEKNHMYGKNQSEETKQKIRETKLKNKNKKLESIIQINDKFYKIKDAIILFDKSFNKIIALCKSDNKDWKFIT